MKNGYLPHPKDFREDKELPCRKTIKKFLKMSPVEYYMQNYPEMCTKGYVDRMPKDIQTEKKRVIKQLDEMVYKNKRIPSRKELTGENGTPTYWEIRKYVGSLAGFAIQRYPEYCTNRHNSECLTNNERNKKRVTEQLDRFVEENGRMPKKSDLGHENNMPTYSEIRQHYISLRELAIERYPEYYREQPSKDEILKMIDRFIDTNGRFPKKDELCEENELPLYSNIRRYFNNLKSLKEQCYPQYSKDNQNEDEPEQEIGMTFAGM